MLTLISAATVLFAGQAARTVTSHITLASMFKNGYAIIVREMDIPASGEYTLQQIPQASLGTLWFTTTSNTKLTSVTNTQSETKDQVPVGSIADILAVNIGKLVTLRLGYAPTETLTGTLVSVTGNLVVLKTGEGTTAVERSAIQRVTSAEPLSSTTSSTSLRRGLRFQVESGGAGKIFMVSLERGMSWAPGYAVTLLDDKKLQIVGKSTAINDLEDLDEVEARFITGFPNMPFAAITDPLVMNGNLDQFMGAIGGGPSGGGFGRGRDSEMMKNQAPAAMSMDFSEAMPMSDLGGMQAEDLFFYRQPKVKLKKGERAYYILFSAEAPYEEIYSWDIDDFVQDATYRPIPQQPVSEDVWHILRFTNTSKQPFSTGAATIFKDGQIIGQDMMRYASVGGKAELRITKAMDVSADQMEEEVTRERGALKNTYSQSTHDLVTLKGTLTMVNRKGEAVTMRVRKQLTGEVISTVPDAKVTKTARGLRDVNSRATIEWSQKIEPGKTLTLTYTYKVYIRV